MLKPWLFHLNRFDFYLFLCYFQNFIVFLLTCHTQSSFFASLYRSLIVRKSDFIAYKEAEDQPSLHPHRLISTFIILMHLLL